MKIHPNKRLPTTRHWTASIGLAGMLVVTCAPALAATATGPMQVTATVTGDCTVGASALAFPSASSAAIAAGNVDATGNVTVNCSVGLSYTVALDVGVGTGATLASRKMSAGPSLLSYTVYTTAGRTTVWGDGTGGSATASGVGSSADQSITAYGRIFSGQTVPAASYSDTVNVTISY